MAGSKTRWTNLGLINSNKDSYDTAAQALALLVLNKIPKTTTSLLCVGCGRGAELQLAAQLLGKDTEIVGIDPVFALKDDLLLNAAQIRDTFIQNKKKRFDAIIAIDSAYHFPAKFNFFKDCAALTEILVFTDFVSFKDQDQTLINLVGVLANAPNLCWTRKQIEERLLEAGFDSVEIQTISGKKNLFFTLPHLIAKRLEHILVIAKRRRRRIAVIGSGLAGLVAANCLAERHDITIFERSERVGLASHSLLLSRDTVVDVPLRMIGDGYYSTLLSLVNKLQIATKCCRVDCTFLLKNNNFAYRCSRLANIYTFFRHPHLFRCAIRLSSRISKFHAQSQEETWQHWLERAGLIHSNDPALECLELQLSWVLSVPLDIVRITPAAAILSYSRGLGLSWLSCLRHSGSSVRRIDPSLAILEKKLLENVSNIRPGIVVQGVDSTKKIQGETFDAVIVAVQASAVSNVMKNADPIFDQFRALQTTIHIHTDSTFMPSLRKKWTALAVVANPSNPDSRREKNPHFFQGACVLTIWLNAYYPDRHFDTDTFQTWNAHVIPENCLSPTILLDRIVHSPKAPELRAAIPNNDDGIFYAGAYTAGGMGLLEQAAQSGNRAATQVKSIFKK
eukprot:CAMPEP_0197318090 /NCGR_PEP_ID=MMETSP0891-20130614/49475_1 /TAXON_ID=44058 ORGANISM="Aureoumbra lagunensis, Strain CCMP1510" /NCGR_SAMPLE_ID=MMETSP0891 /ASSEMBLY_ACC=CAM_ASM_000534 /LENGTH=620 /DNA_ID=CAMNT_0042808363 /DNA_START=928 /DNA_END=2791 /DNA_ORIENTATION=+